MSFTVHVFNVLLSFEYDYVLIKYPIKAQIMFNIVLDRNYE